MHAAWSFCFSAPHPSSEHSKSLPRRGRLQRGAQLLIVLVFIVTWWGTKWKPSVSTSSLVHGLLHGCGLLESWGLWDCWNWKEMPGDVRVCVEGMGKRAVCTVQGHGTSASCASYGGLEVGQASERWGRHSTLWPGEERYRVPHSSLPRAEAPD